MMIEYIMLGGVAIIILTIVVLTIIHLRLTKRQKYMKMINGKMETLTELQEELNEKPQANLPAEFFEKAYTEVK